VRRRLARKPERLAARREHGHSGAVVQQPAGDLARAIEHVLAIVEHQHHVAARERPHDRVGRPDPWLLARVDQLSEGRPEARPARQQAEVGEQRAGRWRRAAGELDRQSGLAGSARAVQGQEPLPQRASACGA
jgi:hypothetical protein